MKYKGSRLIIVFVIAVAALCTAVLAACGDTAMTKAELANHIFEYKDQKLVDQAVFDDGTKILETSDHVEIGSLYTSYLPDGSVMYEYYDAKQRKIFSSTAKKECEARSAKDIEKSLCTPVEVFDVAK